MSELSAASVRCYRSEWQPRLPTYLHTYVVPYLPMWITGFNALEVLMCVVYIIHMHMYIYIYSMYMYVCYILQYDV